MNAARVKLALIKRMVPYISLSTALQIVNSKRIKKPFLFDDVELKYLFHSYNNMGLTERSAEIPIIKHYLARAKWGHVLEIGNVTNYYEDYYAGLFPNKTVVDKIERNYNIVTCDIAKFRSDERFDFIFSISTFEHMDSDLGRNPDYVAGQAKRGSVAADNIVYCYETLLQRGGLMVITAPLGYTPEWDQAFKGSVLDEYGFKRFNRRLVSRVGEQEWVQRSTFSLSDEYRYGDPYPYANHVSIIEIEA